MIVHTQLASFPRPGLRTRLIHSVQTVACVSASTEHVTISSFGTTSAIAPTLQSTKKYEYDYVGATRLSVFIVCMINKMFGDREGRNILLSVTPLS